MIWTMRGCWKTWFREGECSRQPVQHKKMTFDQTIVCVQREYRELKYQNMSEVGGFAFRFSGVRSSSQEQLSWGNYNREKRVCTVSVNRWATNEEEHDEEKCGPFQKLSGQGEQRCSEPSLVCLGGTEDSQKEESWNNHCKFLCGGINSLESINDDDHDDEHADMSGLDSVASFHNEIICPIHNFFFFKWKQDVKKKLCTQKLSIINYCLI